MSIVQHQMPAQDDEIQGVRRQGYADAAGEREQDLNAIAAPVFDARGSLVAILGVQGPASRFDRAAMRDALPALLAQAGTISNALGWTEPPR